MCGLFRFGFQAPVAIVAAAIIAAGLAAPLAVAGPEQQIVVGRVSNSPAKTLPRIQVLADHLAKRLSEHGMIRGHAIVAKDNEHMRQMLLRGEVHILSETAISALWLEQNAGAVPLMREWKGGERDYNVVFISRKDSGVTSLSDLPGTVIGFEDPGSTTGFLAPVAMLTIAGLPVRHVSLHTRPSPNEVGYVFADSELNVAAMVERGLVDVGTMSNLDWQQFSDNPRLVGDLQVFHTGAPLPRSILLAGPELPPELRASIQRVLAEAHTRPADASVLQQYYGVSRYETLSGGAGGDLETARDLYPFARDAM